MSSLILDKPEVITVSRLDEILEEISNAASAIQPAQDALAKAEAIAAPLTHDDGTLSPEAFMQRRDEANRSVEAARLTLTRAQRNVEELNDNHRASLIDQCATLRTVVASLSEKAEAEMRRWIAEIIDPKSQSTTGFNPMTEEVSRLLLHSPRLRALRGHAESLARWNRPNFGGKPHNPTTIIHHVKEALSILNPTQASR